MRTLSVHGGSESVVGSAIKRRSSERALRDASRSQTVNPSACVCRSALYSHALVFIQYFDGARMGRCRRQRKDRDASSGSATMRPSSRMNRGFVQIEAFDANHSTRKRRVSIALIACLVVLDGCAHYTAERLAPAQTAKTFDSRTLTDPALRAFIERSLGHKLPTWPPPSWDLRLLTLVTFYYSPTLDVARARWNMAKAAIITAGARPNPSLVLVPAYSTNPPVAVGHGMPSIGFDIPIETAGKRGYRIAEAQQIAEAARWNVISAAWHVRRRLTGALLGYAVVRHRMALLKRKLELQRHALRLSEIDLAAGEVAGSDLIPLRLQVSKTSLALAVAGEQVIRARANCADALGVPLRALEGTKLRYHFNPANVPALTSAEARRRALQRRSDILARLAEYEATQAALQLEIAKQYPDIHLGPGYAWSEGENMWSLGLTVGLPVLDQNQGPIAEAVAHRREAAASFVALQAHVIHEVDTATVVLKAADDAAWSAERLLRTQQRGLEALKRQRRAGAVGEFEVLTARIHLSDARILVFEARVRRQQSLRALEDALQRPLGSEGDAKATALEIESTRRSPR